jgi:hypothetical protein
VRGCVETRAVEDFNGHPLEHLSALRINERGAKLLRAALEAERAARPRVRRGMVSGVPRKRAQLYVSAAWQRTWTGEPTPDVVGLIERSRHGR